MSEEVTLENEIDPNVIDHMHKMSMSMINDFFDGEEALKSEIFYRIVTGKPSFTKEEIEQRVNKWIEKEREIWTTK